MPLILRHLFSLSMRCRSIASMRWRQAGLRGGLFLALLLSGWAAQAAPFAYLADRASNNLSVIDIATYLTTTTTPLATGSSPVNVVANKATKKVYIGTTNSIVIVDATTNAIIGSIPLATGPLLSGYSTESQSLVVNTAGTKAYALTAGLVSVIDLVLKSVTTTIAVPVVATGLALESDGDTLFVATGNFGGAVPSIIIIDALLNRIDRVVSTGTLIPLHIGVHPDDSHLYIVGIHSDSTSNLAYSVLDPLTAALSVVAVVPPPSGQSVRLFNNFVFNQDGSRMYLAPQTLSMTTIPILEINTTNGSVTRVLSVPSGYADEHYFPKMAASFAGGKFTLMFSILEHLHHYPSEPPRRVVFLDGVSGVVLKELVYPSQSYTPIVADLLDPASATVPVPPSVKATTTTTLRASTNPPLRPNIPLVLNATVTGNAPTGQVVFQFAASPPHSAAHPHQPVTIKVRDALSNGTASIALPACNARWANQALRQVVCSNHFDVTARYQGDKHNKKSVSAALVESR